MRLEKPACLRDQKVVVIVGGGFAGLNTARRLANVRGVRVLLIDKRNHHLFQPLAWNYLFSRRESRLITEPEWRFSARS